MESKIELKLLNTISQFVGMTLQHATINEKNINGKIVIVLELTFQNENKPQTMVLVLDKEMTLNNSEKLYNDLIN